jgi:hypothetical protein
MGIGNNNSEKLDLASNSKDMVMIQEKRSQPWKSSWPPIHSVKPASEQARAGALMLQGGGGAYPNFIKSTEGVRL